MSMLSRRPARVLAFAAAFASTAVPAFAHGGRYDHYRRDRGIDAGDVLAGVLILGGLAAVASAATKKAQERTDGDGPYRYPDGQDQAPGSAQPPSADYGRGTNRGSWRGTGALDRAVDACVADVEREGREVETVDTVERDGDGWRVAGRDREGESFTCGGDRDGQDSDPAADAREDDESRT